jgi:VanZ family protein
VMKRYLKYSAILLIFFLVVNCAGIYLKGKFEFKFSSGDLFTLSLAFAAISSLTLFIFFTGRNKEEKEQVMHTFVALSTKFLTELALVIIWFVLTKKTSITYVILFFVLYLSFSMLSLGLILKTLKKKSL